MRAPPQVRLLPDGRRLHLQDGPIDLIVEAFGDRAAVSAAYRAASQRFLSVLDELCAELPLLRQAVVPREGGCDFPAETSVIVRRMKAAVAPFAAETFITPMAAVAGAVAEDLLDAMTARAELDRAYVNNGGDIALHLTGRERFRIGMVDRPDAPGLFGHVELSAGDPVRGIATSGCRGRSFSLGIADAVTVLAGTAAAADAAATIIANAVDLPAHPGIRRVPAADLQPDSDLGSRLVTRTVPPLSPRDIDAALASGVERGRALLRRDLIVGAALHLQGVTRIVGIVPRRMVETAVASTAARDLAHV